MSERPPARWCHAHVLLEDFAIINWEVDPDRVRKHLPAGFAVEERNGAACVAMVAFRNRGFHFRAAPFARLSCGQADYRTFVRHGDERGVWFFGGSLSSRLVLVATALWRMPWHREPIDILSSHGDGGDRWTFTADGGWGAAAVALTSSGRPLQGTASDEGATLVDPMIGWYARSSGGIGRYSVWHEPLQLQAATAHVTRCDAFERLGVIDKDQEPSSAGLQWTIPFDVHTPPTRVAAPSE